MLPTDPKERKAIPLYTFLTQYFPDALIELVKVSVAGNDQHNPGQPLHWARSKSTDQLNTAMRHLLDHGMGNQVDTDGTKHLAKAAWRIMAELQLNIEANRAYSTGNLMKTALQQRLAQAAANAVPSNAVPPFTPGGPMTRLVD